MRYLFFGNLKLNISLGKHYLLFSNSKLVGNNLKRINIEVGVACWVTSMTSQNGGFFITSFFNLASQNTRKTLVPFKLFNTHPRLDIF